MDLRQLECLVAVVDEGSFTRAAERLELTQPGVSALIGRLERELGHRLLVRGGRAVVATDLGRTVVAHARSLLATRDALYDAVDEHDGLLRGRVVFGTLHAGQPTPAMLAGFRRRCPGVELAVVEASTPQLIDGLRASRYDVVAIGLVEPLPPQLHADVVAEKPLVAVVPEGHPFADRPSVSVADLGNEPLLCLPEGSASLSLVREAWRAVGAVPRVAVTSPDPIVLSRLAAAGEGVAIVPSELGADYVLAGVVLPVDGLPSARMALVRRSSPVSPATVALYDHLRVEIARRSIEAPTPGQRPGEVPVA